MEGANSSTRMSDLVLLPSRMPQIGPAWALDPLRGNQILFWKFGLGFAKPWVVSLNVATTKGHHTGM